MNHMHRGKFRGHRRQGGYVLLTLLLWAAILSITVVAEMELRAYYKTQIKRDQEEELVHRGVEYERAIRKYFRKFGSYPPSLEMLESANHMRFLRRRYKDPMNGKDFKLLHQADVMQLFAAGIGGGGIMGGQTLGQPVTALSAPPPPASNPGDNSSGDNAGSTGAATTGTNTTGTNTTASSSGDSSQSSSTPGSGTTLPFTSISGGTGGAGQTFGGGGIVGVASVSPEESIRVFNKKNHYNEWLFAYNPSMDRGGLPRGPYEPTLQAILPGQIGMQPGQNGLPQGLGQPGLGQPGVGQPGTMGPGMPTGNR